MRKCRKYRELREEIPESAPHGLVVHVRLVLVEAPEAGHRLAVHQLEDPLLPVAPLDVLGAAVLVLPSNK
jgi:hypothetical protein